MLLELPNELLTAVFSGLDTLTSAVSLAKVHARLNEIWRSSCEHLVINLVRSSVLGFDDALEVAIAETHHVNLPSEKVCVKDLVPLLLENDRMCKLVHTIYHADTDYNPAAYVKPDGELWSSIYYGCLLLACAHDWPALRKKARRRVKRLSPAALDHYAVFLTWFTWRMWNKEVEEYHSLFRPKQSYDPDYGVHHASDRWQFAHATCELYESAPLMKSEGMGPDGWWAASACNVYRPEWE